MMSINDELSSVNPPPLRGLIQEQFTINPTNPNPSNTNPSKRKRNLPGTPDPDAEVIAMSPKSLMATNRFVCEICNKGFQRDQNLQLHRRGHNLPWKLKQRNKEEVVRKKVYICPEKTCAHHHPSRALGDLTGIKKHYSRKHGEKKWKCDKCSKKYAVMSDWKAHNKICGTREYKKDSFITHRAFCDALVEESARFNNRNGLVMDSFQSSTNNNVDFSGVFESGSQINRFPLWLESANYPNSSNENTFLNTDASRLQEEIIHQQLDSQSQWLSRGHEEESFLLKEEDNKSSLSQTPSSLYYTQQTAAAPMSATALLHKAAQMGSTRSAAGFGFMSPSSFSSSGRGKDGQGSKNRRVMEGESSLTRDFLGVGGKELKSNFFASTMEMGHYNRNH
ncbi:zinc finger protein BALDIBIS-like isoform X2 [Salvia splendens]|uniref:zinc finger protein BALDIBIS-like isoform X2 n=1 Tax=Salvia splendens TaxID=180675 RepID=UPI001C2786DA|nr:zinc finger protein BALDIBIS-like isoform X2 [Salvia splendens]